MTLICDDGDLSAALLIQLPNPSDDSQKTTHDDLYRSKLPSILSNLNQQINDSLMADKITRYGEIDSF